MISLRLPPEPRSAARARASLSSLRERVTPEVLERIRLLVSELVTNSIRHARLKQEDWIGLRVDVSGREVHVEVCDRGPGFDERVPEPSVAGDHGWGLYLVKQLADRWGVGRSDATCVWFEIDLLGS